MKKAGISGLVVVIKIRQSNTSRKVVLSDWHIRFSANKIIGKPRELIHSCRRDQVGEPAFKVF
jgi:hypothetical protein